MVGRHPPSVRRGFDPELNPVYPFMLAPEDEPGSTDPAEVARLRDAATAALGCGDLRDLLATSEAPMTLGASAAT